MKLQIQKCSTFEYYFQIIYLGTIFILSFSNMLLVFFIIFCGPLDD